MTRLSRRRRNRCRQRGADILSAHARRAAAREHAQPGRVCGSVAESQSAAHGARGHWRGWRTRWPDTRSRSAAGESCSTGCAAWAAARETDCGTKSRRTCCACRWSCRATLRPDFEGAALLGAKAVGLIDDLEKAAKAEFSPPKSCRPTRQNFAAYADAVREYSRVYDQLLGFWQQEKS